MKQSTLAPAAMLAAILALSLWNSAAMTRHTQRWRSQLDRTEQFAAAGDWQSAADALSASYEDWSGRQVFLHIVSQHDAVDDAEAMYRRAMAFAAEDEASEFRAEVTDLRDQLRLLSEMERFSVKNIL